MKSIKPGRGPSMMGGIVCIAVAVFGLLWTIGASSMSSSFRGIGTFHDPAFGGGIDAIFPLFGVVFIIIAVVSAVYNFKNATGKKRFSEYDIMDSSEEPDPLNERFGEHTPVHHESVPEADAFCPYCGTPVEDDYRFCNSCGKKLPQKHTVSE